MRSIYASFLLLALSSPALAQTAPNVQAPPMQGRVLDSASPRTDLPVVNPTTMQLQMQMQELGAKLDELTSLIEAQAATLASIQSNIAQSRQASNDQYKKLRTTGFLDCYQTAANSTWGYGEGEVAVRHCTGELGPMDKVPF